MNTQSIRIAVTCALCATSALPFAARSADDKIRTLHTVTVVGHRLIEQAEQEQAVTPGGVTLVDGEDLQERSVSNMSDLLRFVPGVWAESGWGSD